MSLQAPSLSEAERQEEIAELTSIEVLERLQDPELRKEIPHVQLYRLHLENIKQKARENERPDDGDEPAASLIEILTNSTLPVERREEIRASAERQLQEQLNLVKGLKPKEIEA